MTLSTNHSTTSKGSGYFIRKIQPLRCLFCPLSFKDCSLLQAGLPVCIILTPATDIECSSMTYLHPPQVLPHHLIAALPTPASWCLHKKLKIYQHPSTLRHLSHPMLPHPPFNPLVLAFQTAGSKQLAVFKLRLNSYLFTENANLN